MTVLLAHFHHLRSLAVGALLHLLEPGIRAIVRDEIPAEPPELDYDMPALFRDDVHLQRIADRCIDKSPG